MGINAINGAPSIASVSAPGAGILLTEARQGDFASDGGAALPPAAAKILTDGMEAAEAAAEGDFVPGLLSLGESTFHQVRLCGQIAESSCKDTRQDEDRKASNNPTGL